MSLKSGEFTETCGEVIRRVRQSRHPAVRQLDLSIDLRVDHSLVSRWETNKVLPTAAQLADIRRSLGLTEGEFDSLHAAWVRDSHAGDASLFSTTLTPSSLVESLEISRDCARSLRMGGQPRIAMLVSGRDARLAFQQLKVQSWTRNHEPALIRLSEVLLEQCKAGLDFLTREEVRRGALSDALELLDRITDNCGNDAAVYCDIAKEGVSYVGGNVGEAKTISERLISAQRSVPPGWLPEVIRAVAINAGKLGDEAVLATAHDSLLQAASEWGDEFSDGTRAFVLEGIARGWGSVDPGMGLEMLDKAWDVRRTAHDIEGDSKLRFVQLVRSQAELEVSVRSSHNIEDTNRKLEDAIAVSVKNGYDRYVQQLQTLSKKLQR
jgi:transcriptional regulator with XRE-family HTH domain